jgi:glutathione peroxidase
VEFVMRLIPLLLLVCLASCAMETPEERVPDYSSLHEFTMTSIDGQQVPLSTYRGKVLLIVNVASSCGYTGQYAGLQELHERYADRGFSVLGFPANDFLGQEPGTDEEIQQFCSSEYGVTFPMFSKLSVQGEDQHPLYAWLTSVAKQGELGGGITWNFNKFLVDGSGKVIGRFPTRTTPDDPVIVKAVEAALGEPGSGQ